MQNGGLGSISEQLLNVRPDVTLGGGSASFTQTAQAGRGTVRRSSTRPKIAATSSWTTPRVWRPSPKRTPSSPCSACSPKVTSPTRWNGPAAVDLTAGGTLPPAEACTENPERLETGLSLASLTTKAIDLLDSEEGFFLQVEGASIDKQDHAANAVRADR